MTVVLDSSGWIELLSGSSRARLYQPALRAGRLLVPAIVRYEVGRYTLTQGGKSAMELALRALSRFEFIPMDEALADSAARLAQQHKFSMADAFVYATAQSVQGELWTQDRHFATFPQVRFFRK
jgi:predicted nucleic acid-binding protein